MNIVLAAADETMFWLEIIIEKQWIKKSELETTCNEGNELTAIFVSSLKTENAKKSKHEENLDIRVKI